MVGKKVYRSSQGKSIDLGALLLQNETVRAVGNMGVNARGDRINIQNKVIDAKAKISQRAYNKQIGQQDDIPKSFAGEAVQPVAPNPYELQALNEKEQNEFKEKRRAEKKVTKTIKEKKPTVKPTVKATVPTPATTPTPPPPPPPPVLDPTPEPVKEPEPTVQKKASGLAEAIARAKTIKQEALQTPRQQAQEKAGVKRI